MNDLPDDYVNRVPKRRYNDLSLAKTAKSVAVFVTVTFIGSWTIIEYALYFGG